MRKNGFTLIEIIGVIVVMAIIILLTLPNLQETLRQTEQKNYNEFIKTIELVTEQYLEKNRDTILLENPDESTIIYISDLISDGLLDRTIENPRTDKKINDADQIKVTLNSNYTRTYEFTSIDE